MLGQTVEIEGVHGLAEFEHDVVGGVHDVVDGGLAERFEATAQPIGRGADLYAAQDARGVAAAQFRALDLDARGRVTDSARLSQLALQSDSAGRSVPRSSAATSRAMP